MDTMIIDGRSIAKDLLAQVRDRLPAGTSPMVRAITVRPAPATLSYIRIKIARAKDAGMTLDLVRLPDDASEEDIIAAVEAPGADAVIVQLPLPEALDRERILAGIPMDKDADVLSKDAYARFARGEEGALLPPVVAAISDIFIRADVDPKGKNAVVIGHGKLVGEPAAVWLAARGANVTVLDEHTFEAGKDTLKEADIIVSGAGVPHLVKPHMLRDGVVLIDAGTSEQGGTIAGDADPACAQLCSVFTSVPGGVGPIAVACLFQNVLRLVSAAKL